MFSPLEAAAVRYPAVYSRGVFPPRWWDWAALPSGHEVQPVQVTVSARHGHLDDATQHSLQEKAEGLLRYFDRLIAILVTVDLHRDRGDNVRIEILAKAEHKHEFVAIEQAADVSTAFLQAADKIKQQIKHYKEKLQDHRRDPSHNDIGGL